MAKYLVWVLRGIGTAMVALILGIAGNLLTPVIEDQGGIVEYLLTAVWLQIGLLFIALLLWAAVYAVLKKEEKEESSTDGKARSDGSEVQPTKHAAPFNAYMDIIDKVMFVNLSALWRQPHSPYIELTVYLRQTSDFPIEITGVEGPLLCGSTECNLAARITSEPITLRPHGDGFQQVVIRQPIEPELARDFVWNPTDLNLYNEGQQLRVRVSGMKWMGTVQMPEGARRLDRVVSNDDFIIQGPVRESDAGELLRPLERIFVSQLQYSLDGQRRAKTEPTPEPEPRDERLVLLCNSYAIPACDALNLVMKAVLDDCFADGGWSGLSARYFRDYVFQPQYGEALRNIQACIDGKSTNSALEEAFIRYCGIYLVAGAFVWHTSKIRPGGALANVGSIDYWVRKHDALIEQVQILSGGIDREALKRFLLFNQEYIAMPRQVHETVSR